MQLQIDLWQVLSFGGVVIGAFWAIGRVLVGQFQRTIEEKFTAVSTGLKEQADSNRQLERDFMDFKATLPRDYVRREDFVQTIATVTVRIENMALRLEQAIRDAYSKREQS
ncbi:hypothetical protein ACG04Q_12015 [Roseateles sp. DXS20W]|uniref:Uncharacterized protein n=1 Tax=Pelomonas lactea TaxID=3299030 RepID=A0ABW7GK12_9BURK